MQKFLFFFGTKNLLLDGGVIVLVVFAFYFCTYTNITSIHTKINFLKNNAIESIIVTNSVVDENNTYIFSAPIIRIFKDENCADEIAVESFMQTEKHSGFESFQLQDKEIALSDNTAKKYKIEIGDILYLRVVYTDIPQKYKVTQIFTSSYGIVSNQILNCGVALIGYDHEFTTRLKVNYVIFSNKAKISSAVLIALEKYILVSSIQFKYFLWLFLYISIFIFVVLSIHSLQNNIHRIYNENYNAKLYSLYRLGLSHKIATLFAFFLSIILFLVPMFFGYALFILLIEHGNFNVGTTLMHVFLSALIFLVWAFIILQNCKLEGRYKKWKQRSWIFKMSQSISRTT